MNWMRKTFGAFLFSALIISLALSAPVHPTYAGTKTNSAPTGPDSLSFTATPGKSETLAPFLSEFSDDDNDTLLFHPASTKAQTFMTSKGTYVLEKNGKNITYTADADASGEDSFLCSISDYKNDSDKKDDGNSHKISVSVKITIKSSDDPDGGGDDSDLPSVKEITGNVTDWPVWPQEIAEDNINTSEPSPLTPVGRDMTAWVTFAPATDPQQIWGETLSVLRSSGQGTVDLLSDGVGNLARVDYFTAAAASGTSAGYLDDEGLVDNLQNGATLPGCTDDWFVTEVHADGTITKSPNQTFPWTGEWNSFLESVPKAEGKTFADSGHAWPFLVWKDDGWTAMIDADYIPDGWGETPRLFVPTNDGLLNILTAGDTGYSRNCAVLPGAAFPVSVYQEHWNQLNGDTPRMTMLDGPIMVRDVRDESGTWHRVLVGTTGLGVDLDNKPDDAWTAEGEPVNPDGSAKELSNGHHFALYGLDVTDPDHPSQLWTLENTHWERDGSDNAADLDMEYCVSRPVIGYTSDGDTRTWHALFVGLNESGDLRWLDLDPITGDRNGTGSFGSETTSLGTENVYPSRILAAYPKEGGEPVLSDVYIYLSDGSLYFWDLQDGGTPFKLMELAGKNGSRAGGCPPVTNFDIAYLEMDDGSVETYFSIVVDKELKEDQEKKHDTMELIVWNIEAALGDDFRDGDLDAFESYSLGTSQGQGSEVIVGSNPYRVELESQGSGDEGFEQTAGDPVFLDEKLYIALYSSSYNLGTGNGSKSDIVTLSRLYTLDVSTLFNPSTHGKGGSTSGNHAPLSEGTDYQNFRNQEAAHMFVDSSGTLFLVNPTGAIVHSADVIDMTAEAGTGEAVPSDRDMDILYWRER